MLEVQFPHASRYTADRKDAVISELRARLTMLPGVVGSTNAVAPATASDRTAALTLDSDASAHALLRFSYVEPNYFQTLGIPFMFGSTFTSERGQTEQAVVLSESAARSLWPGRNPVGRSVRLGATDQRVASVDELLQKPTELLANGPAYQVLGVVRDIRGVEFDGSGTRQVYLPMRAGRFDGYPILVRIQSDPAPVIKAIDSLLASIDADILGKTSSLGEMFRQSGPFLVSTLSAAVASTVGMFGLLLASMGIYGTVSYVVLHRTREIGIRMALGAKTRDVLTLVLSETVRPVVAGVIVGLLFAVGASSLLRRVLYGVRTVDGVSFIGVSFLFLCVALLAAYVPARRAARVDPNVALRYE
jgi:putative ABC transport system permease protein